jgi:hypothetical protein
MLRFAEQTANPRHCGFLLTNPLKGPSLAIVPDENIRKNLEGLYIWLCILK